MSTTDDRTDISSHSEPAEALSEKKVTADVETNDIADSMEGEISPFNEVNAAVPSVDHDLPVNTLRMWFLGILVTSFMGAFTQLFRMYSPPISISPYVMILLVYPVGKLMGRYTPDWSFRIFGSKLELNPGPFNYKEHAVIAIMAIGTTSYDSGAFATWIWTAMVKDLDIPAPMGFRLLSFLSSQGLAFGLAGIFQRILVDPAYCVWPSVLPTCTLIHGMHNGKFGDDVPSRWKIEPIKFFWIAITIASLWQFVPGFLFTGLSYFAFVCWAAPDNVLVNQLFGSYSGMDLIPLTLDWNQITAYQISPLVTPLWAILNVIGGSAFFLWIVAPAMHWSNVWYGKYFTFSSSSLFDNTGNSYNTSRIITSDFTLNETAYNEYSPVYLTTTSALSYGLSFGSVVAILVHAGLYYRSEIWRGLMLTVKRTETAHDDIHVRMMRKYKTTPTWWYGVSLVLMAILSMVFVQVYNTGLPWWGVFLSLIINLVLFVPIGILMAICNQNISTNVVAALIGGYMWPGKIVGVMMFKMLSFVPQGTALFLARDQKFGHYMKIPPRIVFFAQALGIIVNWLVQTFVNEAALENIKGICTPDADGNFTCGIARAEKASMVFWGLIGPARLFSSGALYRPMLLFFLFGGIAPVVVYLIAKRFPRNKILNSINIPVILSSTGSIPPATAINLMTWGVVGLVFQWYIRLRANGWWTRYNFFTSAALDGGLAITSLLIFIFFDTTGVSLSWWGNNVDSTTADYNGLALLTVPAGETFGPTTWK